MSRLPARLRCPRQIACIGAALAGLVLSGWLLSGCTSHDSSPDSAFTYGSGPGHTRPKAQTRPAVYKGLPGVTPHYEPLSRGGNKYFYAVLGKCYEVWHGYPSYEETGIASWYGPGFHGNRTSNGEIYNQKGFSAAHKNLPLPSYLKVTNLSNARSVVVRVNDRGPFHGNRILDLSEGAAQLLDMTRKGTAQVRIEYIDVGNNAPRSTPRDVQTACHGDAATGTTPSYIIAQNPAPHQKPGPQASISAASQIQASAPAPPRTPAAQPISSRAAVNYIQVITSASRERATEIARHLQRETGLQVEVQPLEQALYRVMAGPLGDEQALGVLRTIKSLGYEHSFLKRM